MTDTAVVENLNKAVDFVGRILVILFRSDDNDYCVCKVAPKKGLSCKTITCTGCVVNPTKGEDYHFTGNIVINPKYGEQVKLSTAELIVPDTIEGITAYFKNGNVKGVGAKTAEKLISAFGTSTLDVIVNEPEKLETVVSKKLAKRIHDTMVQNEIETKAKNAGRFTDFAATYFWSSTEYSQTSAWHANFGSGNMGNNLKCSTFYCRPLAAF